MRLRGPASVQIDSHGGTAPFSAGLCELSSLAVVETWVLTLSSYFIAHRYFRTVLEEDVSRIVAVLERTFSKSSVLRELRCLSSRKDSTTPHRSASNGRRPGRVTSTDLPARCTLELHEATMFIFLVPDFRPPRSLKPSTTNPCIVSRRVDKVHVDDKVRNIVEASRKDALEVPRAPEKCTDPSTNHSKPTDQTVRRGVEFGEAFDLETSPQLCQAFHRIVLPRAGPPPPPEAPPQGHHHQDRHWSQAERHRLPLEDPALGEAPTTTRVRQGPPPTS